MSGLVVSRSVFEQRLGELEQQIGELNNSTRRLRQSTNKIETDFEADMLSGGSQQLAIASGQFGNPKSQILNAKSFDSLELDRYTEFHQTMRDLIETTVDTSAINSELDSLKGNLEMLFESQRQLIEEMQDKLLRLRMVTFGTLSIRLQRTVRVTGDDQGKSAELTIEGENLEVDTQILDALVEPLLHLLRNAVAHGIESPETRRLLGKPEAGRINLRVHDEGTHFILTVSDDGRGISAASLKAKAVQHGIISEERAEKMSEQEAFALIFHAGLTTAEEISQVSGRGVGMNIVKNAVVRQQGTISIDSEAHKGTTFTIRLPMALAVTRALLVKAGEQTFAFPLKIIKHISRLTTFESLIGGRWRETLTGGQTGLTDNEHKTKASEQPANSAIFYLNELLGLPPASVNDDTPLLLLKTADTPCALLVDEILKPEEIVIKPLGNPLQNLPALLGATILGDGSIVPVLDLLYLIKSRKRNLNNSALKDERRLKVNGDKLLNVLIVDDSPSVRHLTSKVIKNAGWTAVSAKDGLEALDVLQDFRELPDVILTDVEMPRMNGYELLASLKKQDNLQSIPVVMITSRANQKHRQKAIDLGVSDYLTKPFDDAKLIGIIRKLTA
jgi:chemosensory pili system protein ChpA (sensor histidine kinase/response regulator)